VAQASRLRVHRASRPVIRALKIAQDRTQEEEERQARLAANQAALARITQIAKSRHVNEGVFDRLRTEYEDRLQQLAVQETEDGHTKFSLFSADYEELSREALLEERRTIVELRNQRVINDRATCRS
jgi:hypothetical protein